MKVMRNDIKIKLTSDKHYSRKTHFLKMTIEFMTNS